MENPSKTTTLIELNVISAQQLLTYKRKIQTYVVFWINPKHKLTTRIDLVGNENPTWNDMLIFTLNPELVNTYSTMVFEIYRVRRFHKDKPIGLVRVLLDNLVGKSGSTGECMAFHVRSKWGEPQGVLNIGVSRLDGMFDEGLPRFLGTNMAVDYRKLMGIINTEEKKKVHTRRIIIYKFVGFWG